MDMNKCSDKELRIYIKGTEDAIKSLSSAVFWARKRMKDSESNLEFRLK